MARVSYEHHHHVPITGPVVLITAGLLFLLNNLGLLPPGAWQFIIRLWPAVLILVGIEIVLHRINGWPRWADLLVVVVAIALLVGLAANVPAAYGYPVYAAGPAVSSGPSAVVATSEFSEPLQEAEQATVRLRLDAGELRLGSGVAESNNLIEGAIASAQDRPAPSKTSRMSDGQIDFALRSRGSAGVVFPFGTTGVSESWDLKLNRGVATDLFVTLDAGQAWLDLNGLAIRQLNATVNAGSLEVITPSAGHSKVEIEVNAGSAMVSVPLGTAARIRTDTAIGSVSVDESRFPRSGDEYRSPDYETAANRVDINVDANVGSATIR